MTRDWFLFLSAGLWEMDSVGRIKPIGPLDLNDQAIENVKAIRSVSGKWSLDESGVLVVEEVQAKKVTTDLLCVQDLCVDRTAFEAVLRSANVSGTVSSVSSPAPSAPPPTSESLTDQADSPQDTQEPATEPTTETPAENLTPTPAPESPSENNSPPAEVSAPEPTLVSVPEPVPEAPAPDPTPPEPAP